MKIKICGITNLEDAQSAIEAGADMLGFNFYPPSPRYITPQDCAQIQAEITRQRPSVIGVGVFVNSGVEEISTVLEQTGLNLAQLSGDEPVEAAAALGKRAFKVVRLPTESTTDFIANSRIEADFTDYVNTRQGGSPALMVDAAVKGEYGGTGVTADWEAAAELARRFPLMLAGGLMLENVGAAVRQVHPWGVDVASGVESSPGKKDADKLRRFIQNARTAFWDSLRIDLALPTDMPEVLALQKLAYRSEAELNDDFDIPPLRQTLTELEKEYNEATILKATVDGDLVGSVRGRLMGETCFIGRVIVHPAWQNCGIGSRLMTAIEGCFPNAKRFELFTSERSSRNLYLYRKLGYRAFRQEKLDQHVNLIFMEKNA